ncbi:MAG: nuclear transport factor 2 family protein [Sandaracinaceae bacterium]|nr:nuclear transport factor 2 family protein [Sandaracinaceae bacterium]
MDNAQTARTRAVVKDYFAKFGAGDFEGAFGLFAPNGLYEFPGRSPMAGSHTIPEMAGMMSKVGPLLAGMKMELGHVLAEGNLAAVQATGKVTLPNGTVYNNSYHFAFEVEGDRILRLKEYMCTYHALEAMGPYLGG